MTLLRKCIAEALGTAMLLMGVVGSGIMASRQSVDPGLILFQNTIATAGVLLVIILVFMPLSGAHFNPVVTVVDRVLGNIETKVAALYMVAQFVGAVVGVIISNLLFQLDPIELSSQVRSGNHLIFSEIVATCGLLIVIFGAVRSGKTESVAYIVAAYIAAAYYFTSSTSFANPAVTVARSLTDSFTGIHPNFVFGFLVAQGVGAVVAVGFIKLLWPDR